MFPQIGRNPRRVRSDPEEEEDGGGKTRMMKELSEDDIVEILARLPVKSLIRFRCVSKHWYSLIVSPNFIFMHSKRCKNNKSVTLSLYDCSQSVSDSKKTSVTFRFGDDRDRELTLDYGYLQIMESFKIVGCFNGVVCFSLSPWPQTYALWNPATGHVREITGSPLDGPPSRNYLYFENNVGSYESGFCFDQVTNSFKVVQLQFTVTKQKETRAQVNVFSTATNFWTEKKMAVPYRIPGRCFGASTCVNGYMHWRISIFSPDRESYDDMFILSYDILNEVFERIEMPSRPFSSEYKLVSYKGSLAIIDLRQNIPDFSSSEVDVWVMNGGGGSNHSWSKILTCELSVEVMNVVGFFRKDDVDLILFKSSEDYSLYVYDPVNGETKKFRQPGTKFWQPGTISKTFIYTDSLASLNQSGDEQVLLNYL